MASDAPQRPPLLFKGRVYAAFLFDMDGTLLDSTPVVERVWHEWATRHGLDVATFMTTIHGMRAEDTIRHFAPPGTDIKAETAALQRAELNDVDGIEAIPGIMDFIVPLALQSWTIVTSAPRALALARLHAAGLPIPETFITAEDVECGKPDPEGYLKGARLLGVPITDCLVFEDSVAGLQAGIASGAQVVAIGSRAAESGVFGPELVSISDYRDL